MEMVALLKEQECFLAGGASAASACLGFERWQKVVLCGSPIFGSVFATSLFLNLYLVVLFLGTAWKSLFWSRLAFCSLIGRSWHE